MNYAIRIERRAQRALARLDVRHRDRVAGAIRGLGSDPRPPGARKLTGRDAWRIRVGDYRVIYEIMDAELVVLAVDVGHRREVYRR